MECYTLAFGLEDINSLFKQLVGFFYFLFTIDSLSFR